MAPVFTLARSPPPRHLLGGVPPEPLNARSRRGDTVTIAGVGVARARLAGAATLDSTLAYADNT